MVGGLLYSLLPGSDGSSISSQCNPANFSVSPCVAPPPMSIAIVQYSAGVLLSKLVHWKICSKYVQFKPDGNWLPEYCRKFGEASVSLPLIAKPAPPTLPTVLT